MGTPLDLRTERRPDGTTVLAAIGELDMSNVAVFGDAVAAARAAVDGATLLVDLGGVDYLDSGAINILFEHAEAIELVVNPILLPVLTVSGLAGVTAVRPAPGV